MFYLQITTVLINGACLAISGFILLCLVLLIVTKPYVVVKRLLQEWTFKDWRTNEVHTFPSIQDNPSVDLSVVVPAYNEEKRLPSMLDECLSCLEKKCKSDSSYSYEVIVVSDGSKDNTVRVAGEYSSKYGCNKVRVLELVENRGKGGAVRLGAMSARGSLILFADADGATDFTEFNKLESNLQSIICDIRDKSTSNSDGSDVMAIAIGSRAHLEDEAIATRSFFRTILMRGFHFVVWLFGVRGIRDTQCGFKLLTRRAALVCFSNIHIEKWAFDVEMLYIAQVFKIPITEIAVRWTEIDGSKIVPVWSWLQMGSDLALMWLRYLIRAWKLRSPVELSKKAG